MQRPPLVLVADGLLVVGFAFALVVDPFVLAVGVGIALVGLLVSRLSLSLRALSR